MGCGFIVTIEPDCLEQGCLIINKIKTVTEKMIESSKEYCKAENFSECPIYKEYEKSELS